MKNDRVNYMYNQWLVVAPDTRRDIVLEFNTL